MRIRTLAFLVVIAPLAVSAQNRGYYRFPAIHADMVVFTSEGDLWEVPISGGDARRLTSHPGDETNAAISPDGKTVAFSAAYEGPTEVYTIPVEGGLPTRRTFDGGATVEGWTPSGEILYSTYRYSTLPDAQLIRLDTQNHSHVIELNQAAQGCYEASGKTLFFTRFPFQGSYAKRYKGGTAQSIWKYTGGQEAVPLTADWEGTSKDAMWWKGRVYFLSDRDGSMNIWSMDENGKNLKEVTHHQGFDIKDASLWDGRIAYSMGADLYVLDAASGKEHQIAISIPSDFDHLRERWVQKPMDFLTSMHISPDGSSLVLTARGRSFVAPVKSGRFVDIDPDKPGRLRDARLAGDKKSLFVLSTESGEVELWRYPANGVGKGEQLTTTGHVLRWEGIPSPDGKYVAVQDKDDELTLVDVAAKTEKKIATSLASGNSSPSFGTVRWSPDSRWLVYSIEAPDQFSQLEVYSIETGQATALTSDRYDNVWPSWSDDGKWLYFLSDRALTSVVESPWGARQPDPYFDRRYKLYAMALKKGERSPFEPADELHPDPVEPGPGATAPGTANALAAPSPLAPAANPPGKPVIPSRVDIDLEGITARYTEVPVEPGNYSDLAVAGKRLCWIDNDPVKSERNKLQCLDIANKGEKPEMLMEGVQRFEISGDGKKMLVGKKEDVWVFDSTVKDAALKAPKTMEDAKVDLSKWTFSVIPTDEYKEAFQDAWRLHRDYFYDRNMHGVNWKQMRDKYGELIGRVRDREELSDLIAEMVSELSALHTFVVGGDIRKGSDKIDLASLGAVLDPTDQGAVVKHVYRADPDRPDQLSPLERLNIDVHEGDVIQSIDGHVLDAKCDPGDFLRNKADKQVLLRVMPKGAAQTRDVVVKPIDARAERNLRYGEWELTRREIVDRESENQIGYIHLRAMGSKDIAQWVEQFSPIYQRQGLIIDVRHNNGGNIDSWILGKLMRRPWMYWQPRVGRTDWNMQQSFRGPLVVLCDNWTASDGEAFSEGFRRLGLGKVIGTRTWGGEIWLSASNRLADEGIATTGETGVFGPERKWLIEGRGVEPDIVVDNPPHSAFEGQDAQLEAALNVLRVEIRKGYHAVPEAPKYPDKSFHISSVKPGKPASNGSGSE